MTTWNYRLVREHVEVPGMETTEPRIVVVEAYYDDQENLTLWCPAGDPQGETTEEWAENIDRMREALKAPVIEAADLPGYDPSQGIDGART